MAKGPDRMFRRRHAVDLARLSCLRCGLTAKEAREHGLNCVPRWPAEFRIPLAKGRGIIRAVSFVATLEKHDG